MNDRIVCGIIHQCVGEVYGNCHRCGKPFCPDHGSDNTDVDDYGKGIGELICSQCIFENFDNLEEEFLLDYIVDLDAEYSDQLNHPTIKTLNNKLSELLSWLLKEGETDEHKDPPTN